MATLEDLISDVLTFLDREDLLDVARRCATEVLYKCHRSGDYARDVTYDTPVAVSTDAVSTSLTLPERYRKKLGVLGISDTGLPLAGYAPKEVGIAPPLQYSGLRPATDCYRIAGSQLTVLHYQLVRPAEVQLAYFSYPQITFAEDGKVSTTSWMLTQFPDVVRWRFILQLATYTVNKDILSNASAQYAESISQMQASELVDLPESY